MELAATRLIAMRKNKGKSIAACLHDHTSYIQNPDKTEQGELVSSYQCSPLTVDEEFMLTKRLYEQTTGRRQKSDVIAYQVRQSFRPGEVTPEEANRIGYEFAERFLKGKHAFIVATHTDRAHIHNHIIYNSTALDGTRKFRDFFFSALAVQRLSDLICLEHQLSVIQKKPYRERQKRILYPPKESNRDKLCAVIDNILLHDKPKDFAAFLDSLEQQGYEVKRGKHPSVKGKGQRRFIRFRTLGAGYTEEEIRAVLDGKAEHQPHPKQPLPEKKFGLLMDIPAKMAEGRKRKLTVRTNFGNVQQRQQNGITRWAIPSKRQRSAWGKSLSCGHTSSITQRPAMCTPPIARPDTAKSFWKHTGKRSNSTRLRKPPLTKRT